jgi:hypothetical protein
MYNNEWGIKTPWPQSATELYRPSDCRLSAKLVPNLENRGCRVVSVTDPHGRILVTVANLVSTASTICAYKNL